MLSSTRCATLLVAFFSLHGCAASVTPRGGDARVDASRASTEELSYRLDGLADDDPRRASLRQQLVVRVAAENADATSLEALHRALSAIMKHYRPNELDEATLPEEVLALAERLLAAATARGDSADALSALCLLRLARPSDAGLREQEARIVQWVETGRASAREDDPAAIVGAFQDAVDDARVLAVPLCPTPAALAGADRVLVEGARPLLERSEPRLRQVKARVRLTVVLTLAAVHLMTGDTEGTVAALPRDIAPSESEMFEELLTEALAPSQRGADGLLALGDSLARVGREPFVAVLRIGRRLHPRDPRFALAVAHLERERGEALAALVAYVDAAELSEGQPPFEPALRELLELGENLVAEEDPRAIPVARALSRLRADLARMAPERARNLPSDRFVRVEVGAALLAGDSDRAVAALRAAPGVEMRIALALAYLETDRAADALSTLDAILSPGGTLAAEADRHLGQILRIRGDVQRALGRDGDAASSYADTIAVFRASQPSSPSARAELALALARSGQVDAASEVFEQLFDEDPNASDAYVDLVEIATTMPVPAEVLDESLQHAIVHDAVRPETLTLLAALVRLSSTAASEELGAARQALHRGAALRGFAAAVAGFALGTTDAQALLAAASTPGRRASAHLLLGLAKRRSGDDAGYRTELTRAVSIGAFNELATSIARELLQGRPSVEAPAARP